MNDPPAKPPDARNALYATNLDRFPGLSRPPKQREPGDLLADIADFDGKLERAFSLVAFVVNRHLVDHILRLSRELELDLESVLIWGVLAHQNVAHLLPPGTMPSAYLDESGRIPDAPARLRPLRLRDLVQITRFPRESVRRKLHRLRDRGYVVCTEAGWLIEPGSVKPELRAFTKESVRRLIATTGEILGVLHGANPPTR